MISFVQSPSQKIKFFPLGIIAKTFHFIEKSLDKRRKERPQAGTGTSRDEALQQSYSGTPPPPLLYNTTTSGLLVSSCVFVYFCCYCSLYILFTASQNSTSAKQFSCFVDALDLTSAQAYLLALLHKAVCTYIQQHNLQLQFNDYISFHLNCVVYSFHFF